jgi:hypothetical protein
VQCPITPTVGTLVVVDVAVVVVVSFDSSLGIGAPVVNRHPAPGGLNAAILIYGGGNFNDGGGGVVGVVEYDTPLVVVDPDALVVGDVRSVVGVAAGERCASFSWNPTMMSAVTQSPRPTRRGQLGPAPARVDSLVIYFECNSECRNYNNKTR